MDSPTNPFPPPPRGEAKRIIVIGGGVTGALSAYELARAGHEVVLVEAGVLGNGSSSRSAACIRQQWTTASTVRGMRYATEFYRRWQEMFGVDSPIRQNGYLFLKDWSVNPEECRKMVAMQQEAGLTEVQLLSRGEIEELFPYLELTGIRGGTWCPTDGFIQPDVVYNSAGERIREMGVRVILNDPVEEAFLVHGGSFGPAKSVRLRSGQEIEGDVFVNAAGVWAPMVREFFTREERKDGRVLPIVARRRYLYFLEGFRDGEVGEFGLDSELIPNMPMTISPRGCYCRPETGNEIMMGWLHHTDPISDPSFESQDEISKDFQVQNQEGFGAALRKEMTSYFPDFEGMGRLHAVTVGFYEDVPDHNPLIGHDPNVSNLIHAAGFSGHGLMLAPFTALIVANLVAVGSDPIGIDLPAGFGSANIQPFAIDRKFDHVEGLVI